MNTPVLKTLFAADFMVGAAVGNTVATHGGLQKERDVLATHFNVVTPENQMKWGPVHPEPERYAFEDADALVALAELNGMKLTGHTLVWHSRQTPEWVYEDAEGNDLGRDALLGRMREHIHAVVGRYRGRMHGWDVVNEAVVNEGMRESRWHNIIGDDLIERAFHFAHEADPGAELYYNDYGMAHPQKRRHVVDLLKRLRDTCPRIDAVGIQGHWLLKTPAVADIEASIDAFAATGVKVMITELDVSVLPRRTQGTDTGARETPEADMNPYMAGLPEEIEMELAERYADLFRLFLRYRDVITRVTFWGVTDGYSWLNHFPIRGRTDYPLLFDRACAPKPAFDAVVRLKS